VRVAGEVAELVDEDRAELRPVPVLADVELDAAERVVLRVVVVLEGVDPHRGRVLLYGERPPADRDVALAGVHAPVRDRDLTGLLHGGAADRPLLGWGGCCSGCGRGEQRYGCGREKELLEEAVHGDLLPASMPRSWGYAPGIGVRVADVLRDTRHSTPVVSS
jgi:hypothetical protein